MLLRVLAKVLKSGVEAASTAANITDNFYQHLSPITSKLYMSRFALLGGGVRVMAGKRHYYVFDGNPGYLSSYGYELRTIM